MIPELPGPKNDWAIPWEWLEAEPWAVRMVDTPQDPKWHAEGDVWAHTRMVIEALVGFEDWRLLPPLRRNILFWAAVLHDVAKPFCTTHEEDGIHSPGHSGKGAIEARRILWEMGFPFWQREWVCGLIGNHQKPYFILDGDTTRKIITISYQCRCDDLGLLALADVHGRISSPEFHQEGLDDVALFLQAAEDEGCLTSPYNFPTAHARFQFFRKPGRNPLAPGHDTTRCTVTVMSGLPGSGKSTWIENYAQGFPVISLDAIREEMGIQPTDKKGQGRVAQEAKERLKVQLRLGNDCVWDGTNLSRDMRGKVLSILADYDARVRIVYVEVSHSTLFAQNRNRDDFVPEAVIEKLTRRWQVPDLTEAHEVVHVTP